MCGWHFRIIVYFCDWIIVRCHMCDSTLIIVKNAWTRDTAPLRITVAHAQTRSIGLMYYVTNAVHQLCLEGFSSVAMVLFTITIFFKFIFATLLTKLTHCNLMLCINDIESNFRINLLCNKEGNNSN